MLLSALATSLVVLAGPASPADGASSRPSPGAHERTGSEPTGASRAVGTVGVPEAALAAYARVLERHVKDGRVDYRALERTDLGALDRFLEAIASAKLPPDREARMAFFIDAYNALVLRSVIAHGRPRSVLDVEGFFNREQHRVAGREVTLDELEKKLLNPFAQDPRTHFVLVCAAVGCPTLDDRPYMGAGLERRLEAATRRYLSSPFGARAAHGRLEISKIFDWYAADFGGPEGARTFVLNHLSEKVRDRLGENPEIHFIDYNWTLNQQ